MIDRPALALVSGKRSRLRYLIPFAAGLWTLVLTLWAVFGLFQLRDYAVEFARFEARGAINRDMIYRRWAASHGGVYVPVTAATLPNPYLADIPERDVVTPSGRLLTLIDPADMTRQVHELGQQQYGIQGHISSLDPMQPENAADPWETLALRRLTDGGQEVSEFTQWQGETFLRLLRPLITEERCLKCHAWQGYRVGDLRGGISVSVPLAPLFQVADRTALRLVLGLLLLWGLGLGALAFAAQQMKRRLGERKAAEQILRAGEERFRALFEQAGVGVAQVETLTGCLTRVNQKFAEIVGYPPAELETMTFQQLTHPEDLAGQMQAMERLWSGQIREFSLEKRYVNQNGQQIWVNLTVSAMWQAGEAPSYHIAVVQDISERRRIKSALVASEEKYRLLFENMTTGFALHEIICDNSGIPIDYRFLEINPAFEVLTGASAQDLLGKSVLEVMPETESYWIEHYGKVALTGAPLAYENYSRELDRYYSVWAFSPQPGQFAVIFSDISERKQVELERERLVGELGSKNEELESVLYAASHDLRSPLVNIQGFGKRLDRDCRQLVEELLANTDPATLRETMLPLLLEKMPNSLGFIQSSTDKMEQLIGGLLRVSRIGRSALKPRKLEINGMLDSILRGLQFQIQQVGATVTVEALPGCLGDENQINQVFTNLLDNALKYHDAQRPLCILVSAAKKGNEVVYSFRDNGVGISPRNLKKVWELFYRDDPRGGIPGEGLGLSLVQRMVRRNNGKAWLESQAGAGSTFFVALPGIVAPHKIQTLREDACRTEPTAS